MIQQQKSLFVLIIKSLYYSANQINRVIRFFEIDAREIIYFSEFTNNWEIQWRKGQWLKSFSFIFMLLLIIIFLFSAAKNSNIIPTWLLILIPITSNNNSCYWSSRTNEFNCIPCYLNNKKKNEDEPSELASRQA